MFSFMQSFFYIHVFIYAFIRGLNKDSVGAGVNFFNVSRVAHRIQNFTPPTESLFTPLVYTDQKYVCRVTHKGWDFKDVLKEFV